MRPFTDKLFSAGKLFFLLGISLLIIRNNSYPWPIKRASDILFLLALLAITVHLIISRRRPDWGGAGRALVWGLGLVFAGLAIADFSVYLASGALPDGSSLLMLGRFGEAAIIMLLAGFIESRECGFFKKALVFQLSTLVYIPLLFLPLNPAVRDVGRFSFFENWPSNVGYYLIVSLSLLTCFVLLESERRGWKFWLFLGGTAGLWSAALWTQSRASYLALTLCSALILCFWTYKQSGWPKKKAFADPKAWGRLGGGVALILFAIFAGFLMLPGLAKNAVLVRFFPEVRNNDSRPGSYIFDYNPRETIGFISQQSLRPNLNDPSRLYLWEQYARIAAANPQGLGTGYKPMIYENTARGPHNTPLEAAINGGFLTLAGLLIVWLFALKNLWRKLLAAGEDYKWHLALFAAFLGLSVAAFFDNMVVFRLGWVILGLGMFV